MNGKHHLITNTCTMLSVGACTSLLKQTSIADVGFVSSAGSVISGVIASSTGENILGYILGAGLFYLGTLLPDVDNRRSTLGRYLYIPVGHRTWTHAIYVPLALLISSIWVRPLLWLFLGYILHLVWDSVSACGVCFFYPFSKYISYSSGARVKVNHKVKLYHTDESSETFLVVIVILLTLLLCSFAVIFPRLSP